jgi:hypothetical protein
MGEFVYLFEGIGKKWPADRELKALEEMDSQNDIWDGYEQTGELKTRPDTPGKAGFTNRVNSPAKRTLVRSNRHLS